jgi:hypothetical protein
VVLDGVADAVFVDAWGDWVVVSAVLVGAGVGCVVVDAWVRANCVTPAAGVLLLLPPEEPQAVITRTITIAVRPCPNIRFWTVRRICLLSARTV